MLAWVTEADISLNPFMLAEFGDMKDRHPGYFHVRPLYQPPKFSMGTNVEQWRELVTLYFDDQAETALRVMRCESGGNPDAYNSGSGASGLFQHLPKYWSERSTKAGVPGADIFDPVANVLVAAWLQATGGWGHWTCY